MANFAQIDENNIVINVLAVPDSEEHRGQEYLNELGFAGRWIKTSANTYHGIHRDPITWLPSDTQEKALRKNYAGIGYRYDETLDAFIRPKPQGFDSFIINPEIADWVPPIPAPEPIIGGQWFWAELEQQWFWLKDIEFLDDEML